MSLLVADIGGTNARLALSVGPAQPLKYLQNFAVRAHGDFADVVEQFLSHIRAEGETSLPTRLCAGVAGPIKEGRVRLTNANWDLDERALAGHFGLEAAHLINDYVAQAWALPHLDREQLQPLVLTEQPEPKPGATKLVLGPGTGLGFAALAFSEAGVPLVINGEGGHMAFAPESERELEIARILRRRYDRVSAERLLSGPGLVALHDALAEILHAPAGDLSPEEIVLRGTEGKDPLCQETLLSFTRILGSYAGDVALAFGAFGGVYLTGGVGKALRDYLPTSPFRARFEAKGRMANLLRAMPSWLILEEMTALKGAAAYVYDQQAVEGLK